MASIARLQHRIALAGAAVSRGIIAASHTRTHAHTHIAAAAATSLRSFCAAAAESKPSQSGGSVFPKKASVRAEGTNDTIPSMSPAESANVVPAHQYPTPLTDEEPVPITFGDISMAAYRIRSGISKTMVTRSRKMSQVLNASVYFKNEFQHPTGSFKERGGRNALLTLDADARRRGVIAASAGNHALALAYHGQDLNIPVTVVMPRIAPITKVQNCRDLGANVLIHGSHIGEARDFAYQLASKNSLTYINGYDHPAVVAGAGTLGMEIIEQVPDVEAVVIPVGGAGLIAGVALAIKTLRPDVKVYGAEPATAASLTAALAAGKPLTVNVGPTLADGLLVPRVGTNAFELVKQHVDKVVLVKERFIALAMLRLVEMEKAVVEGGGATGLAAMLQGLLPELQGRRVVVPLCGGNVDTPVLGRVLERGLAADGRLVRFEAVVSDRPGGIAALTKLLADSGASIKDIYHERAWVDSDIASVRVKVIVETADRAAANHMFDNLTAAGYEVERPRSLHHDTPSSLLTGMPDPGTSVSVE